MSDHGQPTPSRPNLDSSSDDFRINPDAKSHEGHDANFETLNVATNDRLDAYRKSQPRSRRWFGRIVVISVLVVMLLAISFASYQFLSWQSVATDDLKTRFGNHPLVVEHMGQIGSCRFSFLESASPDAPESDLMAFRVTGTRNQGFIYIKTPTDSPADADWAGMRIDKQFWPLEND